MTSRKENSRSIFAGKDAVYPEIGDRVLITEGEFLGQTFEVVDITGNAYSPAYRVHVAVPEEGIFWYWPWNIEIDKK